MEIKDYIFYPENTFIDIYNVFLLNEQDFKIHLNENKKYLSNFYYIKETETKSTYLLEKEIYYFHLFPFYNKEEFISTVDFSIIFMHKISKRLKRFYKDRILMSYLIDFNSEEKYTDTEEEFEIIKNYLFNFIES